MKKKRTIEGRKKGGGRRKTDVAVTLSLKTCQGTSHESKVPKSFTSSCPICLFFLVTCCVLLVNKTRFNNGAANSCDYCSGKSLPDIHIGRGRLADDGGKTDRPAEGANGQSGQSRQSSSTSSISPLGSSGSDSVLSALSFHPLSVFIPPKSSRPSPSA